MKAKKFDEKLPQWSILRNFEKQSVAKTNNALCEVSCDGVVPVSELEKAGFKNGVEVKSKADEEDEPYWYTVGSIEDVSAIVLTMINEEDGEEEEPETVTVTSTELMMGYVPKVEIKVEARCCECTLTLYAATTHVIT